MTHWSKIRGVGDPIDESDDEGIVWTEIGKWFPIRSDLLRLENKARFTKIDVKKQGGSNSGRLRLSVLLRRA